jgi:hypothetical protein
MPQVLVLALIGGAVWLAWRALKRQMLQVGEELRRRENATREVTPLEQGEDGVYRPRDRSR